MAINGGVKFFDKSKNLFADGATITATSGSSSATFAIDRNKITRWRSVGSSDSITETLTITLPTATTIDRILLLDHNFKSYTVKYNGGTDFTSVVGLDGALGGGISETTFSDDSSYYEFASVSVTTIEIAVTTTQVADEEKYLNQAISTTELGTLQGFPLVKPISLNKNARVSKTITGKRKVVKSLETLEFRLDFKNYPARLTSDVDLVMDLDDRDDSFIVWLCGGRRGTDFFTHTLKGFRLRDAITMQTIKVIKPSYAKSVYTNQVNFRLDVGEST